MVIYIQPKEEKLGMLLQVPLVSTVLSFQRICVYLVHETKRGQNIPNCVQSSVSVPYVFAGEIAADVGASANGY
jgi:hypothetical protein